MSWQKDCVYELESADLFEDSSHRSRFKELLNCYQNYSFLTKGLCKCMYLSAWDDEHFCIMLSMMNQMSIEHDTDTKEMQENGEVLAHATKGGEYYIYKLSCNFLSDTPFVLPPNANIDERSRHIIEQALKASAVIDRIKD